MLYSALASSWIHLKNIDTKVPTTLYIHFFKLGIKRNQKENNVRQQRSSCTEWCHFCNQFLFSFTNTIDWENYDQTSPFPMTQKNLWFKSTGRTSLALFDRTQVSWLSISLTFFALPNRPVHIIMCKKRFYDGLNLRNVIKYEKALLSIWKWNFKRPNRNAITLTVAGHNNHIHFSMFPSHM